jgi:hypothetical protein
MHRNMVGLVTLDCILRVIFARVVGVPLVIEVFRMNFDYIAADKAGLLIPSHIIADFESFRLHWPCHPIVLTSSSAALYKSVPSDSDCTPGVSFAGSILSSPMICITGTPCASR